jgi:DeoR/GlpR family transcriptional regulator of sugar metabolism
MSNKSTEAQRKLAEYAENNPHLSYKELADRLECSQQTVSRACLKFGVRRKRGPLTDADLAKLAERDTTQPVTTNEKAANAAEANDAK